MASPPHTGLQGGAADHVTLIMARKLITQVCGGCQCPGQGGNPGGCWAHCSPVHNRSQSLPVVLLSSRSQHVGQSAKTCGCGRDKPSHGQGEPWLVVWAPESCPCSVIDGNYTWTTAVPTLSASDVYIGAARCNALGAQAPKVALEESFLHWSLGAATP